MTVAFALRVPKTDRNRVEVRGPARTSDLADFVGEQDILCVGGGNTARLLALWRTHGLDSVLEDAWKAGAIFAGLSAGMICWFHACVTDSFGGMGPLADGLAWLTGSACPHYDSEAERRTAFHAAIAGGLPSGHAADDGAALHFVGTKLVGVVSSRSRARAYRVFQRGAEVQEEVLATRFLGE